MGTKIAVNLEFYSLCNYLSRTRKKKIFKKQKQMVGPRYKKEQWANYVGCRQNEIVDVYNNYNA